MGLWADLVQCYIVFFVFSFLFFFLSTSPIASACPSAGECIRNRATEYGVVRSVTPHERTAAAQQGFSFRVLLLLTLSPHTWLSPLCRVGVTDTMIPRIRLDAERRLCWEPLSLNFYISIDLCLEAEIQFQGPIFRSWLVWVCWGAGQQLEK